VNLASDFVHLYLSWDVKSKKVNFTFVRMTILSISLHKLFQICNSSTMYLGLLGRTKYFYLLQNIVVSNFNCVFIYFACELYSFLLRKR